MAFICERCEREFKSKGGLTKHGNRKIPCGTKESPQASPIYEELESSVGKGLYDLLRVEGLVGIDAFKQINILLTFKLLERRLSTGEIEIPQLEEDDPTLVREAWEGKLYLWSNFVKRSDSEWFIMYLLHIFEKLRDNYELQLHLPNPREIKIEKTITLAKICNVIDELDVTGDSFGDVYENMLSRQMMGKDLGQFFTPYWVRKWVIETMNLQRDEGGELPTVYDPAAGTGGFLTSALRWFKKTGPVEGVSGKLFGVELNENTYRSGLTHLFIATGENPTDTFVRDNSLSPRCVHTKERFDYILSNPPFGVKETWENTVCPIKTNSGTSLFLQQIVRRLKVGGRAGVVFPMGKELFSDRDLKDLRTMLMKCCELESVTKLPKTTFSNTGVATCVLVFTKRCEVEEAMTVVTKGKTQKRSFAEGAFTREVVFGEIVTVPGEGKQPVVEEIGRLTIEEIIRKGWSLRLEDYREQSRPRNEEGWPVMKLDDLCIIESGKFDSKEMDNVGEIPFYSCSANNPVGTHSIASFDHPEHVLVITSGGSDRNRTGDKVGMGKVYLVNGKVACRAGVRSMRTKNPEMLLNSYLYIYLKIKRDLITFKAQFTTSLGTVNLKELKTIEIVVPPIEEQLKIAERVMKEEKRLTDRIKSRTQDIDHYREDLQQCARWFKGDYAKLGEICTFGRGKPLTKKKMIDGPFPVVGGGRAPMGVHSESNVPEKTILIARSGSVGFVSRYDTPLFVNDDIIYVDMIDSLLSPDFLYYSLKYVLQDDLFGLQYGAAQKHVKIQQIVELVMPVPSMDEQIKIVEKMKKMVETVDRRIRDAEEEITDLKEALNSLL